MLIGRSSDDRDEVMLMGRSSDDSWQGMRVTGDADADCGLQVLVNNGLSNKPEDFELCLRAVNVHLPSAGYLGVSAATGGLAGMVT